MYIGFYSFTKQLNKNKLFLNHNLTIGDNLMYPFVLLGQRLKQSSHKVATIDTDDLKSFDAVVFLEFPTFKNKYFRWLVKNKFENLYLITLESPIIKPDNYNTENHKYFKKIFTWSDKLIDNRKYFKINYSHNIPVEFNFNSAQAKKPCTLISGNKSARHPSELYTERNKAIRWFEKNHPEDFDLYGIGWDHYNFMANF